MSDSYGATCLICGERYYNDNETHIQITRIERDGITVKTIKWNGMVCDACLYKQLGLNLFGSEVNE